MLIRDECPGDEEAIQDLILAAFEPMPFSNGSEASMIQWLRNSGDLTLSLVAEEEGEIVGHIAFSPVTIEGHHDKWFGLGPVSVKPEKQRQGIGSSLILKGLELLKARGARGCALIGDPDLYGRVGFESDGKLQYKGLSSQFVQRIVFSGPAPSGKLAFAPAFEVDSPHS